MAVRTGYTKSELAALAEQVTVDIRAYLVDLVAYNISRGSVSLDTTLTYLALITMPCRTCWVLTSMVRHADIGGSGATTRGS